MSSVRFAIVAVASATMAMVMAGPAAAGPKPEPQPTKATVHVTKPATDAAAAADLWCVAYFTPVPQYSASNRTIHVGGHIECNFTGNLHFRVNLYTIVGSGENQRKVWQDWVDPGWKVGSQIGGSGFTNCVGSASTRWIASLYGDTGIGPTQPYPLWSAVYTFPCGGLPE